GAGRGEAPGARDSGRAHHDDRLLRPRTRRVMSRRTHREIDRRLHRTALLQGWHVAAQDRVDNAAGPAAHGTCCEDDAMEDTTKGRFADMILRRPVMRHLSRGLTAAGIAGALSLAAADAEAQDPILSGQAGTYVGCSWGGGGAGVTWGFEGRVGGDFRDEYQPYMEPFFTTSAVARFGFVGVDPGLWVGAQAGGAIGLGSLVAELTLGYQWGEHGGFSVPIGLGLDVFLASTFVRGDPVLGTIAFGGGLVAPPRFLQPMAIAGRALHDEEGHAALPTVEPLGETRADAALGNDLSGALRRSWEQRAKAEWASVPAFLQLADQLHVAGAPDALIARAHRAAD